MGITEIFLVALLILAFLAVGYWLGKFLERKSWEDNIDSIREEAIRRSRSVLTGSFSEQLAPFLPGFKHSPTEVRFIGKPVDFIVFEGLDSREISKVIFVEVKSGKAHLSPVEISLKKALADGRIGWELYRPPEKPQT